MHLSQFQLADYLLMEDPPGRNTGGEQDDCVSLEHLLGPLSQQEVEPLVTLATIMEVAEVSVRVLFVMTGEP